MGGAGGGGETWDSVAEDSRSDSGNGAGTATPRREAPGSDEFGRDALGRDAWSRARRGPMSAVAAASAVALSGTLGAAAGLVTLGAPGRNGHTDGSSSDAAGKDGRASETWSEMDAGTKLVSMVLSSSSSSRRDRLSHQTTPSC